MLYYNLVLIYGNQGTYSFILTAVYMEYGKYDAINKKWTDTYGRVTFNQSPPSAAAAETNNLNTSSAKSLDLVATDNGYPGMHGFFVYISKDRKNGPYSIRITRIKNRMQN